MENLKREGGARPGAVMELEPSTGQQQQMMDNYHTNLCEN